MLKQLVNPDSLKELSAIKITDEIKSFITDLSSEISSAKSQRATWETNIDKWRNLRYGIRNPKSHPWPKCANYSIPLIDSNIQKLKPSYVNLAFGVTPICIFEPYGAEDVEPARKKELLFDWRMKTQVKFFDQYCYGVDHLLEQGACVFKVIWKFSTDSYIEQYNLQDLSPAMISVLYDVRTNDDILYKIIQEELGIDERFEENVKEIRRVISDFREGKQEFTLELLEVKEDRAQVLARDLREDIVIPVNTLIFEDNLDNAQFIDDRIWMSKNDLLRAMKDKKYETYLESEIDSWIGQRPSEKKGSLPIIDTEDVLIHETCCWYDVNDDGIKERCIVTWPDGDPSKILRFIGLPYDHNQWPYTLIKRELNDPGVYSSRGIPALDEDVQVAISTAVNQAEDFGTIVNTPKIVMRRNTVSNLKNQRYIPGEPVITNGPTTDYEIRQQVNLSQPILFQFAQYMKGWSDIRIGNLTTGLTQETNLPGAGQYGQKTKAEINLISYLRNEIQSLELQIFQQQMARVYHQIDSLYEQFGSDVEEIAITGEPPIRITRRETQGRFNITPTGKLENTNPLIRAQKVFNLMRIFAGDPDIRQYELKKIFLNDFDPKISKKILLNEQEIQQRNQMQQRAQQMMKQLMVKDAVSTREIGDLMDLRKEARMALIQGRKYAPD